MLKNSNLNENYFIFSEFILVKAEENNTTNNSMRKNTVSFMVNLP